MSLEKIVLRSAGTAGAAGAAEVTQPPATVQAPFEYSTATSSPEIEGKQGKKSKSKKGNKMRQSAANPAHSKKKVKGWNKPPHTFKKSVTLDHDDSSGIDGGNITSPTSDSEGADGEDDDDDEDNLSGVADLFGVDDLVRV